MSWLGASCERSWISARKPGGGRYAFGVTRRPTCAALNNVSSSPVCRPSFFSRIGGIGAGDAVLGPLPPNIKLGKGIADRLAADLAGCNALGIGDFGHGVERPDTGLFAKGARALVQQGAQLVASGRVEDSVRS